MTDVFCMICILFYTICLMNMFGIITEIWAEECYKCVFLLSRVHYRSASERETQRGENIFLLCRIFVKKISFRI